MSRANEPSFGEVAVVHGLVQSQRQRQDVPQNASVGRRPVKESQADFGSSAAELQKGFSGRSGRTGFPSRCRISFEDGVGPAGRQIRGRSASDRPLL